MTTSEAVVGFGLIALLLTITPGLDTALVLRAAITRGRRDGLATALGVIGGVVAWGAAAAVGVSALVTASSIAYAVLRLVGAAYMVWLGGRILWRLARRRAESVSDDGPARAAGVWRSARTGLLTNLLNPKVGAFYVAALPQFIPPGTSALGMGLLLACVHAALSLAWFTVLVLGANAARRWLQRPRVSRTVEGTTGIALIGFGARLALSSR
ncbi:LysE family translocator [Modestobacter versicolor]|uniref:LysE family translocator n=1 Tax=Modestobacter versicolor TaxID=429133 RepID=UPI0034DF3BB8